MSGVEDWKPAGTVREKKTVPQPAIEKASGGSAFPWCGELNECPTIQLGMTLRDYFAAKALQGMLSNPNIKNNDKSISDAEAIANAAFIMADAMLKERSK